METRGRNKQTKLPDYFLKIRMETKLRIQTKLLISSTIFLTNISTKLEKKISSPDSHYISPQKSNNKQNSVFLNLLHPQEIIKITKTFKGCGMGPWLVLVSPCFRGNVVATCKIGSFLCSLDNLL